MQAGTQTCTSELDQDVVSVADFLLCTLDKILERETSIQIDTQVDMLYTVFK